MSALKPDTLARLERHAQLSHSTPDDLLNRLLDDLEQQPDDRQLLAIISEYVLSVRVEPGGQLIVEWAVGAFSAITGYDGDIAGMPLSVAHLDPDDQAQAWHDITRTAYHNQITTSEYRIRHYTDHQPRWLSVTRHPIWDAQAGRVVRFYSVATDITARKQAEAALNEVQARYRALWEQTNDAVFLMDAHGTYLDVNRSACEMFGYSVDEIIGMSYRDLVEPMEQSQSERVSRRLIAGEQVPIYERTFRHRNGHPIYAEVNVHTVRDDAGNILCFQSLIRNITCRKLAEAALYKSESRLRSLMNSGVALVIRVDLSGVYRYCNPAFIALYGDLAGQSAVETVFGASREEALMALIECLEEPGKPVQVVLERQSPVSEQTHTTLWEFVALVDSREVITEIQCVGFDVTEQVRAREELQRSEDRFHKVFHSSPLPIAILRRDNAEFIDVNDSFLRMTGYTRDEMIGKSPCDLNLWCDAQDSAEMWALLSLRESIINHPVRLHTRTGDVRHCLVAVESITFSGMDCVISQAADVTDLHAAMQREQEAQRQLFHADRLAAIGRLSASIAHELNNPLQAIYGALAIVRDEIGERAPDVRHYLDISLNEMERMANVVYQMREMHQTGDFQRVHYRLADELDAVISLLSKRLEEQGIALSLALPPDLPALVGVPRHIRQALLNILLNAVEAMPNGGTLTIKGRHCARRREVRLVIHDTGAGISDPHRVFEPFYTTKEKGLGLGLAITRQIIHMHHGRIRARRAPQGGTDFVITLPVDSA